MLSLEKWLVLNNDVNLGCIQFDHFYIYHIIISNILALLIVDPAFTLFPKIHVIRVVRKIVGVLAMIFGPIAVNLGLDAVIEKLKKYRQDKIAVQDDNQ